MYSAIVDVYHLFLSFQCLEAASIRFEMKIVSQTVENLQIENVSGCQYSVYILIE